MTFWYKTGRILVHLISEVIYKYGIWWSLLLCIVVCVLCVLVCIGMVCVQVVAYVVIHCFWYILFVLVCIDTWSVQGLVIICIVYMVWMVCIVCIDRNSSVLMYLCVLACIGMYWYVMICICMYLYVLYIWYVNSYGCICIGLYWMDFFLYRYVCHCMVCNGIYWYVLHKFVLIPIPKQYTPAPLAVQPVCAFKYGHTKYVWIIQVHISYKICVTRNNSSTCIVEYIDLFVAHTYAYGQNTHKIYAVIHSICTQLAGEDTLSHPLVKTWLKRVSIL